LNTQSWTASSLVLTVVLSGCAPMHDVAQPAPAASLFDGGGYPVEVCDAAYAGRAAACAISGSGPRQLLRANLISGGRLLVGGSLLIGADGRIEAAGCAVPVAADTVLVDCPGALVSAGLLNLHEHIDYSYQQAAQAAQAQAPTLTWQHRNDWRKLSAAERGFEGDAPTDKTVQAEVSERAMLRHALSGATAVSGAKDFRAFLRNLKLADAPLAVPAGSPVLDNTFPVNDARSMETLAAPCSAAQVAAVKFAPDQPFIPHVGEGTNAGARWEVDCVLDAITAKTTPSAFIHGVAISAPQITRLKAQHVAVVLSPRSNFRLYGATAPVLALQDAGVTLALGTDWSPSGSLTLLDEARCLARYNHDSLQDRLSAADLHRMMTSDAARAVGLQQQVGALAAGEWADLVVFDTEGSRSLAAILARTALRQTLAVMVGGRIASAPLAWAGALPQLDNCSADPRDLCGQQRLVCGANSARPLAGLLRQAVYTLDDSRLCQPQTTDDCVLR
jgi:cytosine/adenosine deaminase-related metal-dependent hydrolase